MSLNRLNKEVSCGFREKREVIFYSEGMLVNNCANKYLNRNRKFHNFTNPQLFCFNIFLFSFQHFKVECDKSKLPCIAYYILHVMHCGMVSIISQNKFICKILYYILRGKQKKDDLKITF